MSKKDVQARALLIANPGSGKSADWAPRLEQVKQSLAEHKIKFDVAPIAHKTDATPAGRKAVRDGYELVIAMGGDGTIAAVIRGIAGSKVSLGIIRSGTLNDIAKSLGIPEDPREACALIASGHTRDLDVGQVRTGKHKKSYFFMATAIGLHATLDPMFKNVPKGNLSGLSKVIRTFLEYDVKSRVFLTLDDDSKIEVQTMGVTVANLPLAGLNNLVAPDASSEDGLLDISVYSGFTKAELVSYFARTAHIGTIQDGKLQRYRARKIKVKTSPKMDVTADGVKLGKGTVRIKALQHALRVFAPEPGSGVEAKPDAGQPQYLAPMSPVVRNKSS